MQPRRLADADAFGQRAQNRGRDGGRDGRVPELFSLRPRPNEARPRSFPGHRRLKFGKDAVHLKQRPARWRRGIERLLVQEQIDAGAERDREVL